MIREQLPQEAQCEMHYLLGSYNRIVADLPDENRHGGSRAEMAALAKRFAEQPETLCWSDVAQAQLCIVDVISDSDVRARLSSWRRRLSEVIGEARYATYAATATPIDSTDTARLRSDLVQCIQAVYYFYAFHGLSAQSRNGVTRLLLQYASGILLTEFVLAIAFYFALHGVTIAQYLLAASAAAVTGSVVSVQRRLQNPQVNADPIYRYVQMKWDQLSVAAASPLSGAVFGMVAYALLSSGLIAGGAIIPKFGPKLIPESAAATALMLVWAFISGFSERFVPDVLDLVASHAGATQKQTPSPISSPSVLPSADGKAGQIQGNSAPTTHTDRPAPALSK